MHFGEIKVATVGNQYKFNVQVFFSDLDPDLVQVELFANGANGAKPEIIKMKRETKTGGSTNTYYYNALVSSKRPSSDYTPRAMTEIAGVSVPLESNLITWQH
jgi:starch phosphorylase